MELKWRKLPSPEKLARLSQAVQAEGVAFLQAVAPRLQREIVERMRRGMVVDLQGNVVPAPPYSKSYTLYLKTVGRPGTRPDFSFTDGMLSHISARISVPKSTNSLRLVIATYGRINRTKPEIPKETITWTRKPYVYYEARRDRLISVPGTTITQPARSRAADYAKEKLAKNYAEDFQLIYNAHLAWWLGRRAGYGKWGQTLRHHLFGISNAQQEALADDWMEHLERSGVISIWATTGLTVK